MTGKLVIVNDTDKEIVTCDNTGNIDNKVTVNAPIDALRDAIATDGGYIALGTGFELGSVHWVNTEGRVTHSYGKHNTNTNSTWNWKFGYIPVGSFADTFPESDFAPRHIIGDNHGCLVVTDDNPSLFYLIYVNRQPTQCSYRLTENPFCVCLDATTVCWTL